jgi:hypothetical protein
MAPNRELDEGGQYTLELETRFNASMMFLSFCAARLVVILERIATRIAFRGRRVLQGSFNAGEFCLDNYFTS